jgi:hypothetical protein
VKPLGSISATAVLPAPDGSNIAVAPNPSPGPFLFTVSVPPGPRPGTGIVNPPPMGGAGSAAGAQLTPPPPDPQSPFTPLWRDVHLTVYDVQGRLARDLGTFRQLENERFNVAWDGRDAHGVALPSGVYFLSVQMGYTSDVQKVTLIR